MSSASFYSSPKLKFEVTIHNNHNFRIYQKYNLYITSP